jgi:hypothetical protein
MGGQMVKPPPCLLYTTRRAVLVFGHPIVSSMLRSSGTSMRGVSRAKERAGEDTNNNVNCKLIESGKKGERGRPVPGVGRCITIRITRTSSS